MSNTAGIRRLYNAIVPVLGVAAVLTLMPRYQIRDWEGFALFLTLAVIAEWVVIPLATGTLSAGFALVLPTYILFGPFAAAATGAIGTMVGDLLHRRRPGVILFNGGQYAIALAVAHAACRLAGGTGPDPDLLLAEAGPLAAYVVAFFLVNHLLINVYFALDSPEWRLESAWEAASWDSLNNIINIPIGLFLVIMYRNAGPVGASFAFLPILGAAYIFRLQMDLNIANRELQALYDVAQRIKSVLELDKVFGLIVDAVHQTVGFDCCALFLWDRQEDRLSPALFEPRENNPLFDECFLAAGGPVDGVIRSREPLLILDSPRGKGSGLGSLMAAPMIAEGQLVGVIVVGNARSRAFQRRHVKLLTILASQAGVAIENAILYQRTEKLAITDPMTGLFNYRYFFVKLGDEIKKARACKTSLSLIYLDIDDFKRYNDCYGHQTGDKVLLEFADIIRANTRDTDTPARYAGDEFVIILPRTSREEAVVVVERIREALAGHRFTNVHGVPVRQVSASMGVSTYPDDGTTESQLIDAADRMMYQQKGA